MNPLSFQIRCICPLNLVPSSRPRVKATVYRNLQFEGFDRIHNYKCNEEDVEEYKKWGVDGNGFLSRVMTTREIRFCDRKTAIMSFCLLIWDNNWIF